MSKVTILQIGRENWMNQLELPKNNMDLPACRASK